MRYMVDVGAMKAYIRASGLTQRQVAEQARMKECTLSRDLRGCVQMKADEYLSVCRVLGAPLERFMVAIERKEEV